MSYSSISTVPVLAHLRSRRCFRGSGAFGSTITYVLNVTMDECLEAANTYLTENHDTPITMEKLLKLMNNNGIKV